MAYQNPYQPYMYQYPYTPQPAQQRQDQGLVWVQGEAGAKSYLVAPGATVLLMDSEGSKFYLKTSDASGVPLPLRVFEYKELTAKDAPKPVAYVTVEEFEKFKEEMKHEQPTV